jgi:hypothetical protein
MRQLQEQGLELGQEFEVLSCPDCIEEVHALRGNA